MHILPPVRPEESIQRLTALLTPIAEKNGRCAAETHDLDA